MATGPAPKQVNDWQTVEPNDWQDVAATPAASAPKAEPGTFDPHPGENAAKAFLRGGVGAAVNFVRNFPDSLEQPSLAATPPPVIYGAPKAQQQATEAYSQGVGEQGQSIRDQVQQAKDNPAYTAGGIILPALAVEGVSRGARALAPRVGRALTGTSPRVIGDAVKDTRAANAADAEATGNANRDAGDKHLQQTQEALHDTQGKELKYQQDVKAAHDKAAKDNAELDRAHEAEVQKSLEETRQKEELHQAELRKAQAESEEAYQKKLAEVQEQRQAAEAKRKDSFRKYLDKKSEVQSTNDAAQRKFESSRSAQGKIAPTQEKLKTASRELQGQIETARNNALRVGNEKYNTVNGELNPMPADMEAVHGLFHEAAESFGETQAMPALVKRLGTALERGDGLTYRDLQPIYSELGKELSKGTLPGTTYHAYDIMQEKIGDEMQRIADSQGKGAQLADARNYWRRMKQTFGKPYNATDAGNTVLDKTTGQGAAEDQANRVRLLGSFDKSIPQTVEHIGNLRRGLEKLPDPVPTRTITEKLAESRKPIPSPPESSAPIPNPESPSPRSIAEPSRTPLPDRPVHAEPNLPAPPERASFPNRPPERPLAPKKIGAEEVQEAKGKGLQKRADWIRNRGSWAATLPLFYSLRDIIHGNFGSIPGAMGEDAATLAVTQGLARVLENPKVVDFLTKATAKDVAAIPEDLRGDFPQIVKQAQQRGIKVSDALARGVQGMAALAPLRPAQNATDAWSGVQQ